MNDVNILLCPITKIVNTTINKHNVHCTLQLNLVGRTTTKKEQRSANTLYQELSFQDNEESEENEIVTGMYEEIFKTNIFFLFFELSIMCKA